MASSSPKNPALRCAIYTRKSTEHGLELEFNSLDAQREACEAYIKSQASLGWKVLPQPYDDPAFSGGNLERPALKKLLKDIEAGKVDVVVVYKIDRLTRSLADFAKLVEAFDARSISFVAVTQQFNTTTSMGRLTLNVLLSFAQFERELSSERVRDKVAASRRKGKWTGGTVPLGYEARDKKLVINPTEAETVRTIFRRYIELQSFGRLVADLDKRGIVTKRRNTKVKKFNGGIPFTYGPLAHFLKNRIYVGETGHGGKWYPGEHKAIVDQKTFDKVQGLLKSGIHKRMIKRSESGALLMGKLFDDRGNAMSPSFSSKNGARYRFYVSSAILRGRKAEAGSVARVSATNTEQRLINALRQRLKIDQAVMDADVIGSYVARADLSSRAVKISTTPAAKIRSNQLSIPWQVCQPSSATIIEANSECQPSAKLVQAIVRAHAWLRDLQSDKFDTVEALAASVELHPKLVRQELRHAFLAPAVTKAILTGGQPSALSLARIPKTLPLTWLEQCRALGF
ncbi:MAG: recombinase family protein [Afipia sp.]|uniref:DNA invertase Pin-like site-specific DNA recombinase n=1 Tax=Afipia massiliensis TaxID=211460 RepID=A0A840N7B4_9BRAD|nr:recombinase family protein [Afipia massiliensis]MAH71180.1 recombinase family protein [Afipia sp.]MBB5053651.1 DNA invertase Pin-like site-specific DNA recombinase [Afipia massiliensis]OUX59705.1 MAG: recombinase family protein [Afipia sp. TMED4]HCX16607.1 recombinase family protein [Afipia sp.]